MRQRSDRSTSARMTCMGPRCNWAIRWPATSQANSASCSKREQSPIPANVLEQYVDAIGSIVHGRVQNASDVLAREIVRALAHLSAAFRRETPLP